MTRKTLPNWNDWCNDKIVLTDAAGNPVLINLNTVKHLAIIGDFTALYCTEGDYFEVKESLEQVMAEISECVKESMERAEAERKAAEEARRAQYEAYAVATKGDGTDAK